MCPISGTVSCPEGEHLALLQCVFRVENKPKNCWIVGVCQRCVFNDSSAGTRRLVWTEKLSNWYWHSAGSFQANYGQGDDCKIAYWSWVLVWTLPPLSVKHSRVLPGVITSRILPKIPPHASSLHSECWLFQSLCNTISSPSHGVFNGYNFRLSSTGFERIQRFFFFYGCGLQGKLCYGLMQIWNEDHLFPVSSFFIGIKVMKNLLKPWNLSIAQTVLHIKNLFFF